MINGSTKITGIFGYPISHTLSPAMHNAAFDYLKINSIYVPFHVEPENLGQALKSLPFLNIQGINITVPHKENALKFLDMIDPVAKKTGSVNTVVVNNGKLSGYSTDGPGFVKSLDGRFDFKGKKILLFGTGGAGKAIGVALAFCPASEICIYDVDRPKAGKLLKAMNSIRGARVNLIKNLSELSKIMPEIDMFINATPVGMKENDGCVIDPELIHKKIFIYDIVYNRQTALIKEAKKKNCKYLNGLDMLLYQGVLSFQLWTGVKAPVEVMRKALLDALK